MIGINHNLLLLKTSLLSLSKPPEIAHVREKRQVLDYKSQRNGYEDHQTVTSRWYGRQRPSTLHISYSANHHPGYGGQKSA